MLYSSLPPVPELVDPWGDDGGEFRVGAVFCFGAVGQRWTVRGLSVDMFVIGDLMFGWKGEGERAFIGRRGMGESWACGFLGHLGILWCRESEAGKYVGWWYDFGSREPGLFIMCLE